MLNEEKRRELLEVFRNLIRFQSVNPPGNEAEICRYIKMLLDENGIQNQIIDSAPGRSNIIARWGSGSGTPLILLSHLDVVPADGVWAHPPFEAVNDNGAIYGRGALDTKQLTAMELMSLIWLKREGFEPNCTIVFIGAADEEVGSRYGMAYLSENYPELLPKGNVISEGGGFIITQEGKKYRTCTCGEKGSYKTGVSLKAQGQSLDPWQTAGGKTLKAMLALSQYEAPEQLTGPTRKFKETVHNKMEDPALKKLWEYATKNCLAIEGYDIDFHNGNSPAFHMNYQFIHGTGKKDIECLITGLLKDYDVDIAPGTYSEGYECDVDSDFFHILDSTSRLLDPDTAILPMLALGRTDGRFIRHNVYGYSPMLDDLPFSKVLKMVHQKDECITEASLYFGASVLYETIRRAAAGKGACI